MKTEDTLDPMTEITSAARNHEFVKRGLDTAEEDLRIAEEGVAKKRAIVAEKKAELAQVEARVRLAAKKL
jgi:hypothetical protein